MSEFYSTNNTYTTANRCRNKDWDSAGTIPHEPKTTALCGWRVWAHVFAICGL